MTTDPSAGREPAASAANNAGSQPALLSQASTATEREAGYDADSGSSSGEEIDANEFDLMLSRSSTFAAAPILEIEPAENAMLRGERRYHSASRVSRRATASVDRHRGDYSQDRGRAASASHWSWRRGRSSAPDAEQDLGDETQQPDETSSLLPGRKPSAAASETPSLKTPYLNNVSPQRFRLVFSVILIVYLVVCFDGTIMASSHPVITSHFGASHAASWLSTAFLLTSAAFQPLVGRFSDAVGRKWPFVAGTAIFTVATLGCALAPSIGAFIAARAVCGLGAGMMMTLASIIVSDLVPIEIRGSYQSILNVMYGVGSSLGAALGGLMADALGWRWEFGVQVPPLLLCLLIAIVAVPEHLGFQHDGDGDVWKSLRRFDYRGSLLLSTAMIFFVLGLSMGGNVLPWSHPLVITSLSVFAVFFPTFLWVESWVDRPIMPLYLIKTAPRANLIFANHIASFLTNAIAFNIVLLTSATTSGLRLVLPSVIASLTGAAVGLLITRTRRLKWPVVTGAAGYLVGTIILTIMGSRWPSWAYHLAFVPWAVGQGLQFPGTFMAVLGASEQREQAVVTSTLLLWRSMGSVLGVAGSSLVLQNALVRFLERFVQGPDKDEVVRQVRKSIQAIARLEPPYRDQVVLSYQAALRVTFATTAVVAAVSVVLLVPIKLPRLAQRK